MSAAGWPRGRKCKCTRRLHLVSEDEDEGEVGYGGREVLHPQRQDPVLPLKPDPGLVTPSPLTPLPSPTVAGTRCVECKKLDGGAEISRKMSQRELLLMAESELNGLFLPPRESTGPPNSEFPHFCPWGFESEYSTNIRNKRHYRILGIFAFEITFENPSSKKGGGRERGRALEIILFIVILSRPGRSLKKQGP